jgi:hypothetical protein
MPFLFHGMTVTFPDAFPMLARLQCLRARQSPVKFLPNHHARSSTQQIRFHATSVFKAASLNNVTSNRRVNGMWKQIRKSAVALRVRPYPHSCCHLRPNSTRTTNRETGMNSGGNCILTFQAPSVTMNNRLWVSGSVNSTRDEPILIKSGRAYLKRILNKLLGSEVLITMVVKTPIF